MEDIIFDEYDEYELQKKVEMKTSKKHRYSTGFRKCALALALAVCVSTGFSAVPGKFDNMATVEAARKKDNKKPVIKLQGAANLQVTQNESVKIPKATAKDNVDGNLTKKIKVSVKCGKKSYADLAKKIQKNKAVKFTKIGKYVVTYTVSDKVKNKATKKRTVTVVAKTEEGKTTEAATTQSPTTQSQTTENKVTTEQVTTIATTEAATAEKTTESVENSSDISMVKKYGDLETITVAGNTYHILKNISDDIKSMIESNSNQWNELTTDMFLPSVFGNDNDSYYFEKYGVLEYIGKIHVIDKYGVDCSNAVFILEPWKLDRISFGFVNSKGEICSLWGINFTSYEFARDYFSDMIMYNDPINSIYIVGLDYRTIESTELLHTEGKNADDVAALQKLVAQQNGKGARIPLDLDNENGAYSWYTWNEEGRLVELDWSYKGIQGAISFNELPELKKINCYENKIIDLSIDQNTKLESLTCVDNQIKMLDVSNNTNLVELSCSGNCLEEIDVSNNKELKDFDFSNNKVSKIDLSNNEKLTSIWCYYNQLKSLDLKNNTNLGALNCSSNELRTLNLDINLQLSYLDCSKNYIAGLDISHNANLYFLNCSDNQLDKLDISKNISLKRLNCRNNNITELDISTNNLDDLKCDETVIVKE